MSRYATPKSEQEAREQTDFFGAILRDDQFWDAPERLQDRYDCYLANAEGDPGRELEGMGGQSLKTFTTWMST